MSIGLFKLISTQKVLKTCNEQRSKQHYLGNNQFDSTPYHHHQTLPYRESNWRLGCRRNIPQGFPSNINWSSERPQKRGKKKEREIEKERGNERDNEPAN